jgi:hypothetical protein
MAGTVSKKIRQKTLAATLLREIRRTRDLSSLKQQGWTYSQIAEALTSLLATALVAESDGKLKLTESGLKELRRLSRGKKFIWMEPRQDVSIAKIDLLVLYIPERRSLSEIKDRTSS